MSGNVRPKDSQGGITCQKFLPTGYLMAWNEKNQQQESF
jgi:hypothetical protein